MKTGNNHMDEWLQRSAETGEVPFNEADWQHMQQLLQRKKKRRFFAWWWLPILLLSGGLLYWLVFADSKSRQRDQGETTSQASNYLQPAIDKDSDKNYAARETVHSSSAKDSGLTAGGIYKPQQQQYNTADKKNNTAHVPPVVTVVDLKSISAGIKQDISKEPGTGKKKFAKNKKNTAGNKRIDILPGKLQDVNATGKDEEGAAGEDDDETIATGQHTIVSGKTITGNKTDIVNSDTGAVANVEKPKDNTLLPIDSSATVIVKDTADSSSQKKTVSKKNRRKPELFLSAAYSAGTVPLKSTALTGELLYSIPLGKRFSVNVSVAASKLRINEQQVHENIKKITSFPGTTSVFVDKATTVYTPANGTMASSALSVGYKTGKWQWSTGLQRGVVLSGKNTVNRFADTFYSYTTATLPAGIKVGGGKYDPADFNGKQFLAANIGARYKFGRMHAGVNFTKQIWNNKVEGVIAEKKKRTAATLFIGIRL